MEKSAKEYYHEFWSSFEKYCHQTGFEFGSWTFEGGDYKHYLVVENYGSGTTLAGVALVSEPSLRIQISINQKDSDAIYKLLQRRLPDFDALRKHDVEWHPQKDVVRSRITVSYRDYPDITVREYWPHQHRWLATVLTDFRKALRSILG